MKAVLLFAFIVLSTKTICAQTVADSIKVPNIFTPNGDGINDVFKPTFAFEENPQSYSFSIYDRYGVLIFETLKFKQHWDGRTASGIPCIEGTYFYALQLTLKSEEIKRTGFVQLLK